MGTRDDEYDYLFKGNGRAASSPGQPQGSPSGGGPGLGGGAARAASSRRDPAAERGAGSRSPPRGGCPVPQAGAGCRSPTAAEGAGGGPPGQPRVGLARCEAGGAALPRASPRPAGVFLEADRRGCAGRRCPPRSALSPECQIRAGFLRGGPARLPLVRGSRSVSGLRRGLACWEGEQRSWVRMPRVDEDCFLFQLLNKTVK